MFNFHNKMTINIIDQIKYRETYVTGEIVADNGDGTYDVKIDNASSAYKNVETRDYDAIFSIGEIVDIGYEYGCKESPKILGHSKKISQEPKQVEVDYSGYTPPDIDIGMAAIIRNSNHSPGFTVINKGNPANKTGKITSIEIYARNSDLSNVEIATFRLIGDGDWPGYYKFSTRGIYTIGNVIVGSKQTFSGLDITVEKDDYIGMYWEGGDMQLDSIAGYPGIYIKGGNQIPCSNANFYFGSSISVISLYGIGTSQ